MWLKLSDSAYFFGPGGINRIEKETTYTATQQVSEYKTSLYIGTTRIQVVIESVDEILEKIGKNNE